MAFLKQRKTVTFILRIWAEYLDETPPAWRGAIETAGKGEPQYFSNLTQLLNLIQEITKHHSENI